MNTNTKEIKKKKKKIGKGWYHNQSLCGLLDSQ